MILTLIELYTSFVLRVGFIEFDFSSGYQFMTLAVTFVKKPHLQTRLSEILKIYQTPSGLHLY